MQAEDVFLPGRIGVEEASVGGVLIDFLVGREPPVTVGSHDDIIDPFVIDLAERTYAVVILVEDVGSVEGSNNDVSVSSCQTGYVVASEQVGMLGIVAEDGYLAAVVAADASALGGIPEETLAVLYHLRNPVRRQLLEVGQRQTRNVLSVCRNRQKKHQQKEYGVSFHGIRSDFLRKDTLFLLINNR